MPDYVDKLRVTVWLSVAGGPPVEGALALLAHSAFHAGPENLLELLEPGDGFLPFERLADDAVVLLARPHIRWVMAGPEVDPDLIGPLAHPTVREERVRVCMADGETFEGSLQVALPEPLNRVSDYLNGPGRFFPLATRQGTFLVRKGAVREVFLYAASPVPLADDLAA